MENKFIYYDIVKRIYKCFEQHNDKLEELNYKAIGKEELWCVSSHDCYYIIKNHIPKIKIETTYFNEFDDDNKEYTFVDNYENTGLSSIQDYSMIINEYFRKFDNIYPCMFGILDY